LFPAFAWAANGKERLLVVVNYASNQSQCYVRLPFSDLRNHRWQLRDVLGDAQYDRDDNELESRGLYLDVRPWQAHVFSVTKKQG
jgi:hypothetical protein